MPEPDMPDCKRIDELMALCMAEVDDESDDVVVMDYGQIRLYRSVATVYKDEIGAMLMMLPHQFRASQGGGWSLLNAPAVEDNGRLRQWGEQRNALCLALLGIACGYANLTAPFMNAMLPGGMPYLIVNDDIIASDTGAVGDC